jgi:hypothetical protein
MTRIMRDSVTAADIPLAGLDLVAGYGNGRYQWSPADWARFRGLPFARIDVLGTEPQGCGVLDVETGDATPGEAPGWVRSRRASHRGTYAVLYCNRAGLPAVEEAMTSARMVLGTDYHLWVATLDGTKTLPDMAGVVAVQYQAATATSGPGHYDQSVVYDDRWHPSLPAAPTWQREALVHMEAALSQAQMAANILKAHQ